MKQVTLRAFYIDSSDFLKSESELSIKLKEQLILRDKVDCRRMSLGNITKEEDVLAYYDYPSGSGNSVFGTIVRIVLGNNVAHITDTLLNSKSFMLSDLKSEELTTAAIYKSHYYFLISNNLLVTNLPSNFTISRLQTYLSWFVDDSLYELSPIIDQSQIRRASDIRKVTVQDPINEYKNNEKSSKWLLKKIGTSALRAVFSDIKNISELELESIISAKLVLEIDKPNRSNSAAIQKFYSAFLKPVSDLDNILLTTRDNQNILKGKDLLKTKNVSIDTDDIGNLNEKNLSQEMQHYVLELANEEKNLS